MKQGTVSYYLKGSITSKKIYLTIEIRQCQPFYFISAIKIEGTCGGTYVSDSYILSPNYPQDYDKGLDCRWLITSNVQMIVKLTFLNFDTAFNSDSLYVYDGTNIHGQLLETISGYRDFSMPFSSTGNNIYLKFSTSGDGTRIGFNIKVESIGSYSYNN